MSKTMTSKNELEIALRIQKRMLAETRRELRKVQETLGDARDQIDVRDIEILAKRKLLDTSHKEKEALVAQKDQMIEMLQRRITSVNAEYNALNRGVPAAYEVPVKKKTPRGHTTLEDVYKITGEI